MRGDYIAEPINSLHQQLFNAHNGDSVIVSACQLKGWTLDSRPWCESPCRSLGKSVPLNRPDKKLAG